MVSDQAIITSNTSSIPADRIFNKMKRPGTDHHHPFLRPGLAVPAGGGNQLAGGRPDTVDWLCWFFAATGKAPMVTDNVLCFMLDRIFDNWCNDAAYLLGRPGRSGGQGGRGVCLRRSVLCPESGQRKPDHHRDQHPPDGGGAHYRPAPILASVDRWLTHRPGGQDRGAGRTKGNSFGTACWGSSFPRPLTSSTGASGPGKT